jgi:hypothetical protein
VSSRSESADSVVTASFSIYAAKFSTRHEFIVPTGTFLKQFNSLTRMETDALTIRIALTPQPETSETNVVARDILEGLILKHAARQWGNPSPRPAITDTQAKAA